MNFEYKKEKKADIVIFQLKGELIGQEQSSGFMDEVNLMVANGENKFVLDLAQLAYINSSGLNLFINILAKSRKTGGDVAVVNVTPKVKQLLVITKLSSIFNLSESIEDAIAKIKSS